MATRTCNDCVYCATPYNEDATSDGSIRCLGKPGNPIILDTVQAAQSCRLFLRVYDPALSYGEQDEE